ncbi:MAG: HypC/HybG/HupF family hydrogenase formation chaperone [Syntrophomonadaceae bacterium]|nr:HypC/HybG/HupF family hydrogenase formation chaperone [Syntrophomonadaceae bacterium]
MCLGVPGRVVDLLENHMARVDVSGNLLEISVRLTPEVRVGQHVLIHAGFAMQIIDEDLARETREVWEELQRYARQ